MIFTSLSKLKAEQYTFRLPTQKAKDLVLKFPRSIGLRLQTGESFVSPFIPEQENLSYSTSALNTFRFAQFFIAPLVSYLSDQSIDHSFKSTHSDTLDLLRKDDNFRIESVEKLMSKENHPYNHSFVCKCICERQIYGKI